MKSGQQEESSKYLVAEDGGGSSGGGGTSRFYECTFCKQGFTTAQALGGHMNIHRRERARIRQPIVPSSSIPIQQPHGHEKHTRPDFPWSISGSFPQAQDYHHHHMYLPSPTSSSSNPSRHPYPSVHVDNSQTRSPCSMRLFEEDQPTNLSLRIGYPEEVKNQFGAEEEVDLELRLGHDP